MNSVVNMSGARLRAAYLGEIRFEFLKSLRTPAFAVPTLFFPIMFYLLFGILVGSLRGNSGMARDAFALYGVFGAMGPGLFGFGVSLAIEREQGLLRLKQALPSPPGAYLLARATMAMLFVAFISLTLILMAVLFAHVPLTFSQGIRLFVIDVLGTLPFCAIGLFVGSLVSGQASPAIVNLIFLPMAFLSGLWLPIQYMPKILADLAPTWPAYHLAQMALGAVGAETRGTFTGHAGVLAGITLVFFLLAMRRMQGSGFRLLGSGK
jgi:ABC-2 type transport system permease protein